MKPILLIAALSGFSTSAYGQVVNDCYSETADSYLTDIRVIPEPWEINTRTFANGDVRLVLLDTWDPANYAVHLMVTYVDPSRHESEGRACVIVSDNEGLGFENMSLLDMGASYDPAKGLTFSIEAERHDPDSDSVDHGLLEVILNRATGQVTARFQ